MMDPSWRLKLQRAEKHLLEVKDEIVVIKVGDDHPRETLTTLRDIALYLRDSAFPSLEPFR